MTLEIEKEGEEKSVFQWITDLKITKNKAWELAETERSRWLIENEGFNIQKNHPYRIQHANSLNNTAM